MALMLATSGLAVVLRPTQRFADQGLKVDLEAMIPHSFVEWRELPQSTSQIISPEQTELVNKLYSQTLYRTYINAKGSVVMLSIAYGADQSDGMALHYPDVCYPAQGFQLTSNIPGSLETGFGSIPVKRLMTKLQARSEAVTYWSTLGEQVVERGLKTKMAQINYGIRGIIPDGLIFRVSSIDGNGKDEFLLQEHFVKDLLSSMSPETRRRFVGKRIVITANSEKR